jgi:hypothetical protein
MVAERRHTWGDLLDDEIRALTRKLRGPHGYA